MKLFLAGIESYWELIDQAAQLGYDKRKIYVLASFFSMSKSLDKKISVASDFLLDSGAFSFLKGAKKPNWNNYVDSYCDFINHNDIQHFFELDIDPIIGLPQVKKMTAYIEKKTGKKPIPVWHKSRGKDEFLKMCDEYPYVAIGGIASKEITPDQYKYFPWFIKEAHDRGAKIHGLGFTHAEGIKKYKFDTVDSTSWTFGNRYGKVYKFTGSHMRMIRPKGNLRLIDPNYTALNNFVEWIKFQRYVEKL